MAAARHLPRLPQLHHNLIPRQHRTRKPRLEELQPPPITPRKHLDYRMRCDIPRAQPMQNRPFEPHPRPNRRIRMQRIIIPIKPIQQRLLLRRLLSINHIGRAVRRWDMRHRLRALRTTPPALANGKALADNFCVRFAGRFIDE